MPTIANFMSIIDRAMSKAIAHSSFWFPHYSKFEKRLQQGVPLYIKPRNEFVRSNKEVSFNRRLQTKRVTTHTKK